MSGLLPSPRYGPIGFSTSDDLWVFDDGRKAYVDAFHFALLDAAGDSLLPELYQVIGQERMLEFLDKFAGLTFVVPTKELLSRSARAASMYVAHLRGEAIEDIACQFGESREVVEGAVERMRGLIRE